MNYVCRLKEYLFGLWYVFVLTGLLAGRFTRQASKPVDAHTGLADTVDAPASKSEWGLNAKINSNDSAGRFVRRNCEWIGRFSIRSPTVEEGTDAAVVSWNENGEDDPQAGPNISILPRHQSSKPTKRRRANITSPRKRGKFDAEAIAEVEDALGAVEGGQTTLSQYALTAPVARSLGGLRSQNKRGKVT